MAYPAYDEEEAFRAQIDPRLFNMPIQEESALGMTPGGGGYLANPRAAPPPKKRGGLSAFLNSPGFAMTGAALGNLGNRGGGWQNPVQAYQQAVASQAALTKEKQNLNPFFEYEQAKSRGYIPETMTLPEYQSSMSRAGTKRPQAWAPKIGTVTDEEGNTKKVMVLNKYDPVTDTFKTETQDLPEGVTVDSGIKEVDTGGEIHMYRTSDGQYLGTRPRTLKPGERPETKGAQEAAVQAAQTDADQVDTGLQAAWDASTSYTDATEILTESERFLEMLESGQVDTGPISSLLYNTLGIGSEELAAMNNESIMQTLRNLGITNLAPVTEREFAEVAKLWATISLQETPNKGTVKHAIKRTKRLQDRLLNDVKKQANRVRTYGGDAAYNDMLSTNPLLQRAMKRPDDDPDIDVEL